MTSWLFLQRGNQRAGDRAATCTTVVNQVGKNRLDAAKVCQFGANIDKLLLGEQASLVTMRAVVQREQTGHLVELESEPLSRL